MLTAMLFALCLTLAVEVPLAALLRVRGWDLVLIGLINCVTNPLVNLIYAWALLSFPQGSPLPYFVLAALELAAVFGEGLAFRLTLRFRRLHPAQSWKELRTQCHQHLRRNDLSKCVPG